MTIEELLKAAGEVEYVKQTEEEIIRDVKKASDIVSKNKFWMAVVNSLADK